MSFIAIPSASSDPISDAQAQAAALTRRINDDGRQVEVLAEQYDGAQVRADRVNAQLADATTRIAAAQATAERTQGALVNEAVTAYMHGGYVSTPGVNAYSGRADLAVQQGYFDLATNDQAAVIGQARAAQAELKIQQAALQADKVEATAALTALADRRKAVEAADAASRRTLSQVQGQLVELVAAQQAQIAAQQEAQEKAILAAQATTTPEATETTAAPAPASTPTTAAPAKTSATAPPAASKATATTARPAATAPATTARAATTAATAPPKRSTPTAPAPPAVTAPPATVAKVVAKPIATVAAPPVTAAPTPTTKPQPKAPAVTTKPAPPASGRGLIAVAFARSQLGKPYLFGGAGPASYDCSGLTMMAWRSAGVSMDHYAADQYAFTARVAIANLQPGDLVFYGSDLHHVGIYVGGGTMIDAPHTGTFVRYDSIYQAGLQPFGGRPG